MEVGDMCTRSTLAQVPGCDNEALEAWYGLLTDIRLAAICSSPVLVSGPRDRTVKVAGRIAADDSRCDGARIVLCDATRRNSLVEFEEAVSAASAVLIVSEVQALSLTAQTVLLDLERARLEGGAGGLRRIIATSSAPLVSRVYKGTFDDRLFYKLNTVHIVVPPITFLPNVLPDK
jgi:Sigma-54 interaction domain